MKSKSVNLIVNISMLISIGIIFGIIFGSAIEKNNIKKSIVIEQSDPYIHIDGNSGFLSSLDVMASFEMFEGADGAEYWMRVERYGFGKAHEFSVDTIQEAEMILRGLM